MNALRKFWQRATGVESKGLRVEINRLRQDAKFYDQLRRELQSEVFGLERRLAQCSKAEFERGAQLKEAFGDALDDSTRFVILSRATTEFIDKICTWMPAMSHRAPDVAIALRKVREALK